MPPIPPVAPLLAPPGTSYTYSTGGATSSLGHSLEYRFDWGDGSYSSWSSLTSASHPWSSPGTYTVRAQARCATHTSVVSSWSSGLSVSITAPTGTINVTSNPSGASFTLSGPANYSGTTPWSDTNAVVGTYTIIWDPLSGYSAPPSETKTLERDGTISFHGVYQLVTETVSAPNVPSGPTAGTTGTSYTYTTGAASSSLGDSIEYRFDWGDGSYSDWSSSTSASHSWSSPGTYTVKAQARCATHTSALSSWSGGKSVTISLPTPIPQIIGIDPSQPIACSGKQWLTITGNGFVSNSNVTLSIGSSTYPIPKDRTWFINSNKIEILAGLTKGTWKVWITNPSNIQSNTYTFQVRDFSIQDGKKVAALALQYWDKENATIMVAIAAAESCWNPNVGGDYGISNFNCGGYASWGLWQIYMNAHKDKLQKLGAPIDDPYKTAKWLSDPNNNVKAAYEVWKDRKSWDTSGFNAWSTYKNGKYKTYLELAREAVESIASYAHPVITSSLEITPVKDKYYVGDTVAATFTITNIGTAPITLDVLTVGGRDPDGQVIDFDWNRNITLAPNVTYDYQGSLTLDKVGDYHFFCAYRAPDGSWNTSIDLGPGLADPDRTKQMIVGIFEKELKVSFIVDPSPAPYLPLPIEWASAQITITYEQYEDKKDKFWLREINYEYDGDLVGYSQISLTSSTGVELPWRVTIGTDYKQETFHPDITVYSTDKIELYISGIPALSYWDLLLDVINPFDIFLRFAPQRAVNSMTFDPLDIPKDPYQEYLEENYGPYIKTADAEMIQIGSPAELRVYDSQGNLTGVVEGNIEQGIPGSLCTENRVIIFFANDSYIYEVVGTEEGT